MTEEANATTPATQPADSSVMAPAEAAQPAAQAGERPVRLLIVGTGGMARQHAEKFGAIPGVTLVAGIDTNPERLQSFQDTHGIPQGFASVQEALDWGEFDAVTNVTPDAVHYMTTLPFLSARKHVLCE
ncbi:MAG TPA: Gfo/Idh/MocA family oxidoreductase, partial [Rubellimicrobium sp.]|nr:Gfo/Idh/MocA family oxidoreductase [Rubellimicrobium sp.]